MGRAVDRIDHVYLAGEHAEQVFRVLSGEAELPVAWPYQEYAGVFASGAVWLGNVILELVSFPAGEQTPSYAVALTPTGGLAAARAQAERRGIALGPATELGQGGATQWTSAEVLPLSSPQLTVFFCDYAQKPDAWRDRCARELADRDGGPLRVRQVSEVVVAAPDAPRLTETWTALLGAPGAAAPQPPQGPALRFTEGASPQLHTLSVRVDDAVAARAALDLLLPPGVTLPLSFLG